MRIKRLSVLNALVGALVGLPVAAAETPGFYRYTAEPGDTLIGIGSTMLRRPDDWRRVQRINRIANPYRMPAGTVLRIPLSMMRSDPVMARVAQTQGEVSGKRGPLEAGARVGGGDEIVTGENGSTTIELSDGSLLTLQPGSRLSVESLTVLHGTDLQDAQLRLNSGRVETQAAKQRGPAARFRILTPTAAVGVRGTQFRVGTEEPGAAPGATRAEVTEGAVGVEAGRARLPLKEGFGVVAAGGSIAKPVALLAPPAISPAAAVQERPLVRVPFAAVAGARAYRAQIASDASFRPILAQAVFASTEAKFGDLADGNYHVRVRAVDEFGLEGRDADLAFRLKARPEPPFASQPQNKAKLRADTVTFAWAQASEAQHYAFQLASDASFAQTVLTDERVAETKLATTGKLAPADYFWRVRSVRADGDAGPWGDVQRFQLRPPPANPEPAKIDDNSLSFSWPAEPGQTFEFQLAKDETFSQPIEARTLSEPTITLPKPGGGTYFMRVRAIDPDGFVGPYTAAQKIEVPYAKPWWLLLLLVPLL